MFKLNKEKYLQIMKAEGPSAALTALHRDQTEVEFETFEGEEGYSTEKLRNMDELREFSRELWELGRADYNPVTPLKK